MIIKCYEDFRPDIIFSVFSKSDLFLKSCNLIFFKLYFCHDFSENPSKLWLSPLCLLSRPCWFLFHVLFLTWCSLWLVFYFMLISVIILWVALKSCVRYFLLSSTSVFGYSYINFSYLLDSVYFFEFRTTPTFCYTYSFGPPTFTH